MYTNTVLCSIIHTVKIYLLQYIPKTKCPCHSVFSFNGFFILILLFRVVDGGDAYGVIVPCSMCSS